MKTCLYCGKPLERTGLNSHNVKIAKFCGPDHQRKYHAMKQKEKTLTRRNRLKTCNRCHKEQHVSQFYPNRRDGGYHGTCRRCNAERHAAKKSCNPAGGGNDALAQHMAKLIYLKPYLSRPWV